MPFQLNPNIPLYYQIKQDLLRKIEGGTYEVGEQLPSEHQLMELYGVSRPTVRQAIVELVQEGILVRGRGKGTFVSQPLITSNAQVFTTFADIMQATGVHQEAKLIETKRIKACEKIAEELKLSPGEEVYEIIRLRIGNKEPLVIRTTQISSKLCPGLIEEDLETNTLYAILQEKYGITPAGAVQSFQAVKASEFEANLLNIEIGEPLMLWKGIVYTQDKTPIERVKALYRGDRFSFTIRQGRDFEAVSGNDNMGVGILGDLG
ncbi:GntR family transcriptional regulator [Metabacillus halosaccharovorans]|uniref:GntR family transcriptional regulator n=1 Tax=Metabacillus halosaccharovorans TaxID=930124 RepID=UPI00203BE318|nr:GntR family transcriptional regulator [Metabacillus halosaccharovorans]MCM3443126.1 GntR family transcriptional regulator [Metabacillus halosaccharovorans]